MITIFGASVTQQKSGYASILASNLNDDVQIYGYGGMQLNGAGVCYIDKVLSAYPSHCFVDWFSTAFTEKSEKTIEYIDTIIHKFNPIECKLIFLFFPSRDYLNRKPFHDFCKKHLENVGAYYIDVAHFIRGTEDILRDNVHTTDYGSRKYADTILSRFKLDEKHITLLQNSRKTRYCNIKNISINRKIKRSIHLKGNCEIVGFLLTIGPHSGLVDIVTNNTTTETENTWDPWCHYDRKHFNITNKIIDGGIKINVLQDSFDTSTCRREFDFSGIKKKLNIHYIYYVGEQLRVLNLLDRIINRFFNVN